MTNTTKRFDKKLFDDNDAICRKKVKSLFKNSGLKILDNPKKMGVDLLVYKNNEYICNIEVERKIVWVGDFKYKTLQIPARKKKYTELDKPTIFIVLNKDLSDYFVVEQKILIKSNLIEVPNKHCYSGEYFYQVPINKILFNKMPDWLK